MGIRENLNAYKGLAIGFVLLAMVATGVLFFFETRTPNVQEATQLWLAYYSDDDGKTLFIDDAAKSVPFPHNGKQAVLARCYSNDGGKTHYVMYLERFNATAKAAMDQRMAGKAEDQDPITAQNMQSQAIEVKLPGAPEAEWTRRSSTKKFTDIVTPKASSAAICVPTKREEN